MRMKLSLFAYLVLLVWVVLWKLEPPFVGQPGLSNVKLVPFISTDAFGRSAPVEVFINLLLFLPLGVFLGVLARHHSVLSRVAVSASTSLVLECTQFVIGIGAFDVTDLITNTAGAAMGLLFVQLMLRYAASAQRARRHLTTWCMIGVGCAWLAAAAFIWLPLHFVQPDVGPLAARFG